MLASNATCRQRLTDFQQHERIDGWLHPAVVYAVDAVQRTHDELTTFERHHRYRRSPSSATSC